MQLEHYKVNQTWLGRLEIGLGLIAMTLLIWFASGSFSVASHQTKVLPLPIEPAPIEQPMDDHLSRIAAPEGVRPSNEVQTTGESNTQRTNYHVEAGDTLERIFSRHDLPITDLYAILEADEPYLHLDIVRQGDQLSFAQSDTGQLLAMSLVLDASKTVHYRRTVQGYQYYESLRPTTEVQQLVQGEINGSFYVSASKAGLSDNLIMTVSQLLKSTLNFRRDLRAGDTFQVLVNQTMLDGEAINDGQLLAVQIHSRRQTYDAFLHHNGAYYDRHGESLLPALLRHPTHKPYRVSSHFNPRRLHPVTGRYAPHNGVDLAMPIGTPVLATGNGEVTRVANHPLAGKYLVIDQFGPYSTRYLHMNKIIVTKGQRVKRGQVIGYSGNTGRSTGPHLHYELHINQRPVDPMKADIPMQQALTGEEKLTFNHSVQRVNKLMAGPTLTYR